MGEGCFHSAENPERQDFFMLHFFIKDLIAAEKIQNHSIPELFHLFILHKRSERNTGRAEKGFVFILQIQIESPDAFGWNSGVGLSQERCCPSERKLKNDLKI